MEDIPNNPLVHVREEPRLTG